MLQLYQKPNAFPKGGCGCLTCFWGPMGHCRQQRWLRASLQQMTEVCIGSRTPGESHKIIPFPFLHCWFASTPIQLRGLFFLLPTKHSRSLMAYCILQGLEFHLQHQLQISLCISEICCNPSMEIGMPTCLSAWALPGATARGREMVSRCWGFQHPHTALNSSHSSRFHR